METDQEIDISFEKPNKQSMLFSELLLGEWFSSDIHKVGVKITGKALWDPRDGIIRNVADTEFRVTKFKKVTISIVE